MTETKPFKIDIALIKEVVVKYFTQILFIPLLFGGLIQIINLFLISPQFLRFFSPTQALADGLLLLAVMAAFCIGMLLFGLFITGYAFATLDKSGPTIKEWEDTHGKRHLMSFERFPIIVHIIIFCGCLFCYYMLFRSLPSRLETQILNASEIIVMAPLIVLINFMISINLLALYYGTKKPFIQDNTKPFIFTMVVINFISVLIYITFSSNGKNIASNFQAVEKKYNCPNSGEKARILYYNDKYIFIERNCAKKEIIIEKFESIFEREAVILNKPTKKKKIKY